MDSGLRLNTWRKRPAGSNLMMLVGPAIHDPDVVLRIDAHRLRKQEPVDSRADLAQILSRGIELEQTRAAVREEARAAHGPVFSPVRV